MPCLYLPGSVAACASVSPAGLSPDFHKSDACTDKHRSSETPVFMRVKRTHRRLRCGFVPRLSIEKPRFVLFLARFPHICTNFIGFPPEFSLRAEDVGGCRRRCETRGALSCGLSQHVWHGCNGAGFRWGRLNPSVFFARTNRKNSSETKQGPPLFLPAQ
jgi:hypothetical protein